MRTEVRFAGVGGQGLVKAAVLLAEAAGIHAGLEVVQTQFYGFETEGGPSCGDVAISDAPIGFPWVDHPDVLVVLAQSALFEHAPFLRPGARVLADDIHVTDVSAVPEGVDLFWVPLVRSADEAGFRKSANMAALGAYAHLTGVVTYEQMEAAVLEKAPGNPKVNRKALQLGYAAELRPHVFAPGERVAFRPEGFVGV